MFRCPQQKDTENCYETKDGCILYIATPEKQQLNIHQVKTVQNQVTPRPAEKNPKLKTLHRICITFTLVALHLLLASTQAKRTAIMNTITSGLQNIFIKRVPAISC